MFATGYGPANSESRSTPGGDRPSAAKRDRESVARFGGDAGHLGVGDARDLAVHAQPLQRHEVAFELGEGGLVERAMVVEVRPVVEAPHQRAERGGREPEHVARPDATLVEEVGRVVDGVRGERPLLLEAVALGVKTRQLTR